MAVAARLGAAVVVLTACVGTWNAPAIDAARPLAERVTIRRDTFGIPHIIGETEAATGLDFGYAQAEDHAEEMARRFLAADGEAARIFGPSFLDGDLAARRLDNVGEARRAIPTLDATFREVLAGFAEGFNLYVRQHRATLPSWVREISAVDALVATRSEAAVAAASPALERSLRQKYPDGVKAPSSRLPLGDLPADATPADEGDGSNALAISGRRTTSGHPILLGNPHLRWQQLYWEAHITVPGQLDFYGSTLVGLPWLRAGFNDRLAYVQTNNAPDNADVFALPLDAASPDSYRLDGKTRPLTRTDVSVEVRQDDGAMKTERRTYWRSHLGPIVYRNATTAYAYRSTALDAWRFFESFWRLSHARSLKQYRSVLAMRLAPTSNYTYADADGNIFYFWNARIPKRLDDGTKYDLDVPGEPKYLWRTLHAAGELPQLLNPAGGYIQNANNPPWFVSAQTPLDPARYPSYFERGELALRPQLALSMLEARETFSVDDVRQLKFDTRLLLAERVRPALLAAAAAQVAPSAELTRARAILEAWDGRASADSRGAVLFQRFWDGYRGEVRQPFAEGWNAAHPTDTPRGLASPDLALKHLEEAVTWSTATYGAADVAWGDVNRYRVGDVDLPGEGAPGLLGAYRVQQYDPVPGSPNFRISGWAEKDRQLAGFGDAWILLVHFTKPVQALSVLAYGQTTDRASPHSRDQIRIFANRGLRPAFYADAEIRAHLEREYRPR
jgi:acyl-homoserine-lactone acylase